MRNGRWIRRTTTLIAFSSLLAACGEDQPSSTNAADPNNSAPSIAGSPATATQEGAMFSFTPTAQDADGDALKFSVQGMPTWTQFNTATGKLNGVPGPGDIGTLNCQSMPVPVLRLCN